MTFRYTQTPMPPALQLLTGRTSKGRPIIPVMLYGPAGSLLWDGLGDSGADWTVFPEPLARQVGLDLRHAVPCIARGVGGGSLLVHYLPVKMRVSDGLEAREWTGIIGFASLTARYALLGQLGFLEFFTANFQGDLEVVELTVNSRYAGT